MAKYQGKAKKVQNIGVNAVRKRLMILSIPWAYLNENSRGDLDAWSTWNKSNTLQLLEAARSNAKVGNWRTSTSWDSELYGSQDEYICEIKWVHSIRNMIKSKWIGWMSTKKAYEEI